MAAAHCCGGLLRCTERVQLGMGVTPSATPAFTDVVSLPAQPALKPA